MPSKSKGKTLVHCVRHFAPAWFAAIMGTGAISILFNNFPYTSDSGIMPIFTYIFFFLNLTLFAVFNAITVARYIMFPDIWSIMLRHPVQSLYLGCYPMGVTTLINIAVGLVYQKDSIGGRAFVYFIWGVWWIVVAISFLCAFVMVHVMKTKQDHAISRMTAVWLLPVVTLIVASSSGGVLVPVLYQYSTRYALLTLAVSTCMVSIGLTLAFMILTMYLLRLIVYGLPPGASVLSVFIPLGPMGQGGYSILLLGRGYKQVFPLPYGTSDILTAARTGETINIVCVCAAIVLWSLASMWLAYALLALAEVLPSNRFPFKIPFWGLIFPNGVYANLTIQLSHTLDSSFFRVWGSIYSVATLCLWTFVFLQSLRYVWDGAIFEAPCLDEVDLAKEARVPIHSSTTPSGESLAC